MTAIPALDLLPLVGVGVGLVLVASALGLGHVVGRLGRGVRVPGVVVDATETAAPSRSSGRIFLPVVRFMTADGALVTAVATLGATVARPRRGRAVTVVYDPARPATVGIISALWTTRLTSVGFMAAGLAVAAACTAMMMGGAA